MKNQNWTEIIKPKNKVFDFKLKELLSYRDLIFLFVKRDFIALYKQTVLGPIWYLIQPVLTTIMFLLVFSKLAGISTDGVPALIFYFAGITCWNYFAEVLKKTSTTFIANANIFGKVYFPRLAVPVSITLSNLITFVIQFILFIGIWVYYHNIGEVTANYYILFFPLLLLIMAMLGLGIGIIISSLTTKYRDLQHLVLFGVQLFMYATPVIYPLSSIPEKYKIYIQLNPMTGILETFKHAFLGSGYFSFNLLIYSFTSSLVILFVGILLFNRIEKNFMDTV